MPQCPIAGDAKVEFVIVMRLTDVDECREAAERGLQMCIGVCENTHGSFICTCPSGYRMSTDQRTCLGT